MASSSHRWDLPEQFCLPRGLAAVRGCVFILYHLEPPSLERAAAEATAYLQLRQHFESMGVLIWLGQPFPPPSIEVRAAYSAVFNGQGPRVDVAAWIVDTEHSFGSSTVRSVSAQMFPRSCETELFREPFEAAAWIAGRTQGEQQEILEGLDALDRSHPG